MWFRASHSMPACESITCNLLESQAMSTACRACATLLSWRMSCPRQCTWQTTCSMIWQISWTTLRLSTLMLVGERCRRQQGPAVTASCASPCPCSSTRCAHTRLTQWILSRCARTVCHACVISWTSLLGRFGVVGCDTCLIVKAHCQALSAQGLRFILADAIGTWLRLTRLASLCWSISCRAGGPSGKVPLRTRQLLLASLLGENTCHRSRIGNALPR